LDSTRMARVIYLLSANCITGYRMQRSGFISTRLCSYSFPRHASI
jgi:hypothetical protein